MANAATCPTQELQVQMYENTLEITFRRHDSKNTTKLVGRRTLLDVKDCPERIQHYDKAV